MTMWFTKRASADNLGKAGELLRRIHDEEPSFWPYGLRADQFDGGLWLISKSASSDPLGFVGWQDRQEGQRRIGHYVIGVLPEHRGKGYARSAVSQLLQKKAETVDEVRALICSHNEPSLELARSLGVRVIEKSAEVNPPALQGPLTKGRILAMLAGGLGTAIVSDQAVNPERTWESSVKPWEWDKERGIMGAVNLGLGSLGGHLISEKGGAGVAKGITAITLAPTKDLVIKSLGSLSRLDEVSEKASEVLARPAAAAADAGMPRSAILGAVGLGVGGLGLAAYMAKRKLDATAAQIEAARAGRVKVTLPTKRPGDAETTLDLPINELQLSQALRQRLGRDARHRLLQETKDRTRRRAPKDKFNPTEKEQEDIALEQEEFTLSEEDALNKVAGIVSFLDIIECSNMRKLAMQAPQVPTPPPLSTNPALRMTQQQVAVNSIDTSTTANPQIAEAQQAATAAAQQASEQTTALQQEAQAQQAQQAQQFEQERMKMQQEMQMLQMQLEATKVESELVKTKAKMDAEIASAQHKVQVDAGKAQTDGLDSDASLVHKQTFKRLGRLQKTLLKGAAIPPTVTPITSLSTPAVSDIDANTGAPKLPAYKPLRPGALNQLNKNTSEAYATNQLAPVGVYRASYGPVGDVAAGLMREWVNNDQADAVPSNLSPMSILSNPDPMSMLESVSRMGNSAFNRPTSN